MYWHFCNSQMIYMSDDLWTQLISRHTKHLKQQNSRYKYPIGKRMCKIHSKAQEDKQFDWHTSFLQKNTISLELKIQNVSPQLLPCSLLLDSSILSDTCYFVIHSWSPISCLFYPKQKIIIQIQNQGYDQLQCNFLIIT